MVAVYVHVYTSPINMVMGDAIYIQLDVIFCLFSLLKVFLDVGRN